MSQVKEVSDAERALKREEVAGITDTNQVLVEVSAGTSPLPHETTLFLQSIVIPIYQASCGAI